MRPRFSFETTYDPPLVEYALHGLPVRDDHDHEQRRHGKREREHEPRTCDRRPDEHHHRGLRRIRDRRERIGGEDRESEALAQERLFHRVRRHRTADDRPLYEFKTLRVRRRECGPFLLGLGHAASALSGGRAPTVRGGAHWRARRCGCGRRVGRPRRRANDGRAARLGPTPARAGATGRRPRRAASRCERTAPRFSGTEPGRCEASAERSRRPIDAASRSRSSTLVSSPARHASRGDHGMGTSRMSSRSIDDRS